MEIRGYDGLTLIGRGGFSSVYRGRQAAVDRDVAIKVLAVDLVDEAARARFRRECATNGRVGAHPGVVTVYDSGFTSDGHPFLSMQLCPGGSLADALRRRGPLPVPEVLHAGVTIAAALAFAHSVGVLHRDIKPENILLGPFGEPLLADFGIATIDDQRVSTMTAASFTINHAAPECLAGAPPSPSADIYELSSTLYTLLAGHPPFVAGASAALVALVSMVMNNPAPPIPRPDIPPSLNGLLLAGLAKTPQGRPPDATAFGRGLQQVQAELGLPVTAWPTAPVGAGTASGGIAAAAGTGPMTVPAPGPAMGQGTGPATGPGTVPWPGPAPSVTGAGAPTIPSAAGAGSPVLIPETIMPFAPSDPTSMGVTPASMTMVAGTGPRPPVGPPPTGPGAQPPAQRPPRRNRTVAIVVGVVVLLLLAGGGTWYALANYGKSDAAAGDTQTSTQTSDSTEGETTTQETESESETESTETTSSDALFPAVSDTDIALTTEPDPATSTALVPPVTESAPVTTTSKPKPPTTVVKTVVVTTTKTSQTTTTGLTIDSFTVLGQNIVGGKVDCSAQPSHNDAPDSGVPILLFTWSAPKATEASFSMDGDLFDPGLPPVMNGGSFKEVPFVCEKPQHTYTLTVADSAGNKTSKTITLQRGPLPTAQPTS